MGHSWMRCIRRSGDLALLASLIAASGCQKRTYNMAAPQSQRPLDPANCGEPTDPNRPNPAHCEGPIFNVGDFKINHQAFGAQWNTFSYYLPPEDANNGPQTELNARIRNMMGHNFGTTTLYGPDKKAMKSLATGQPKVVRDLHYHLGGGRVGLRPIPVTSNWEKAGNPSAVGSAHLDELLRAFYYCDMPLDAPRTARQECNQRNASRPLFAIGANLYPDGIAVDLAEIAEHKSENSIGHSMVYIGDGWSRHSPQSLHENQWTVSRHEPTTVIGIKFRQAPARNPEEFQKQVQENETVNANIRMVARLLNELNGGPMFPGNYTFDPVRIYNLQSMLEFFRKWIRGGREVEELRKDHDWAVYCAEFVTLAVNLGVNVPLNQDYFVKIWGPQEGQFLWKRLQERLPELGQGEFAQENQVPTMPQTAFVPLWERGATDAQGRVIQPPLTNPKASSAPNVGLAWPLETTADLIAGFVENYANWPDYGPAFASTALLGFAQKAGERIGVDPATYIKLSMPVVDLMFAHFLSMQPAQNHAAVLDETMNQAVGALTQNGSPAELIQLLQSQKPAILQMASQRRAGNPIEAWNNFQNDPELRAAKAAASQFNPPLTLGQFKKYLRMQEEKLAQLLAEAKQKGDARTVRALEFVQSHICSRDTFIRFNAPPHLSFRVAQGVRPSHPALQVMAIGTLFSQNMVEPNPQGVASWNPTDPRWFMEESPAETRGRGKGWDAAVFRNEGNCPR